MTTSKEAAHHSANQPEELAEVIDFPGGAEQEPHASVEAPTEELETVAEEINTQEDAPLSRDEMRQMEQIARGKIQLGEYDLWAEMTKADANGVDVDIDELIKKHSHSDTAKCARLAPRRRPATPSKRSVPEHTRDTNNGECK